MVIGNISVRGRITFMDNDEVTDWMAGSMPGSVDVVYNTDQRSFFNIDGAIGEPYVKKYDGTAPASGSVVTLTETINKTVLLFALNGQMYRVSYYPAADATQVYHKVESGEFWLYIGATPATQFNSEWLSVIYTNDVPFIPV